MSRVSAIALHPKVNLGLAFVTAFGEIVSWFTTLDDAYHLAPVLFILCVYFIGMVAVTEHLRAEKATALLKPRLTIEFEPQPGSLYDSYHVDGALRHIRVAILNTGETVQNAAIKLTRIVPQTTDVSSMQELRRTHEEPPSSRMTVHKSEQPLNYVDLITQAINPPYTGATTQMGLDFVGGRRLLDLHQEQYLIWLEIDGEGAGRERKFVLRKNHETYQFDMYPAPFN